MAVIRYYRLFSLFALVAGVLVLFMGFFLVWVVVPIAAIGFLYLGFGLGGGVLKLPLRAKAGEGRRCRSWGAVTGRPPGAKPGGARPVRLSDEAPSCKIARERERRQGSLVA